MEEIKEIILSHCKGIAYPEFELEDLNVMVKEINDHYTNVKSQELTKAKEEVESLKKLLSENITDANDQRHNFVMAEIKVKSQAKEIEGLRELI
jgi:thermostable 8-oxoguanine DNA glycosylase